MPTATSPRALPRRTVARGALWAIPAAAAAGAAPAYAASNEVVGTVCRIARTNDPSHFNNIGQYVYVGWSGTPNSTIAAGTSTSFTIRIEQTRSSGSAPGAPGVSYGNYFTGSVTDASKVTPSSGYATAYEYTFTITSTQALNLGSDGQYCGPFLTWAGDNAVRPSTYQTASETTEYNNTVFTVTGTTSGGSAGSSVAWDVGGTYKGSGFGRPLSFVSSSGYATLPSVNFTAGVPTANAAYCTSDNKSTWSSTCYNCVQDSAPTCGDTCGPATCTKKDCSGSNCR